MESTDSPEIPDRGETSDIPGLPSRSVSAGIVVVEQQVLGSTMLAALAPPLEDSGQAVVGIPVGVDRLPVLRIYGGYVTRFKEEACHHLFCNTLRSLEFHRSGLAWKDPHSRSLEFHRSGLAWKDPHSRLLHCLGIVLKNPLFVAIVTMSQKRLGRPLSNFFSTDVHCSTIPLFCCSVKL